MTCRHNKDSNQSEVFTVHMKHWVLGYPLSAQWRPFCWFCCVAAHTCMSSSNLYCFKNTEAQFGALYMEKKKDKYIINCECNWILKWRGNSRNSLSLRSLCLKHRQSQIIMSQTQTVSDHFKHRQSQIIMSQTQTILFNFYILYQGSR